MDEEDTLTIKKVPLDKENKLKIEMKFIISEGPSKPGDSLPSYEIPHLDAESNVLVMGISEIAAHPLVPSLIHVLLMPSYDRICSTS